MRYNVRTTGSLLLMQDMHRTGGRSTLWTAAFFCVVVALLVSGRDAKADTQILVPLPVGKMLWNPVTKLLYALMPASDTAGDKSNTLTAIDPVSGKIVFSKFAGGELNTMSFSANYRYLYIALGNSIRVFHTADNSLGSMAPIGAGLSVAGMCPAPGMPDCVLIQQQNRSYSPSDNGTAVVLPDGSLMKKTQHSGHSIVYDRLSDRAFGYENQISSWDLPMIGTDSDGVVVLGDANGMLVGNAALQSAENGLLFTNNGNELDPIFKINLGHFGSLSWQSQLAADGSTGKVYALAERSGTAAIDVYNMYTMAKIGTITASLDASVRGPQPRRRLGDTGGVGDLVRFGEDGLAFRAGTNMCLVRSPMVGPTKATADLAVVTSGLPAVVNPGDSVKCTATVYNKGKTAALGVVLTDLVTDNVDIVNLTASRGSPVASNHGCRLELESLAPGSQASVHLELKVRQVNANQAAASPVVVQTAFVRSQMFDPNPENNRTFQQARVNIPLLPTAIAVNNNLGPDRDTPPRPAPPRPDLVGIWKSVKQSSEGAGSNIRNTLVGELDIKNQGKLSAPHSKLRLFVSEMPQYDPRFAILLQEATISPLRAGAKYTFKLNAHLRFGDDVIGLYIIAVVNSDKAVKESDTSNNLAIIRVP